MQAELDHKAEAAAAQAEASAAEQRRLQEAERWVASCCLHQDHPRMALHEHIERLRAAS